MDDSRESDTSRLDPEVLRRLIQGLEATDIDELEVVTDSSRLYLKREPGRQMVVRRREIPSNPTVSEGVPVAAPLTGIFYSRPRPTEDAYVSPGAQVLQGQVVGLIETMKLYNEVTVEVSGEIVSIVASDGDLVEAGQPLMYVRSGQEGA